MTLRASFNHHGLALGSKAANCGLTACYSCQRRVSEDHYSNEASVSKSSIGRLRITLHQH